MSDKIAHLADVHLGYRQYNGNVNIDGVTLNTREYDVFCSFRNALRDCRARKVETVLIAGDMFHTIRPSNWVIENTIALIQQYENEMDFYIIGGNHDTPLSTDTLHILSLVESLSRAKVAYNEPKGFILANGARLWMEPIRPLGMDITIPDGGEILMIHGVHPRFDRNMASPWYVKSSAYNPDKWKYIAWGDSHDFQRMAPNEYYAGSLDYVSTSAMQEHQAKGYIIYDMSENTVTHIPLVVRPHVMFETEDVEEAEQFLKEVCSSELEPVVKIRSSNSEVIRLKEYRKLCLNLSFDLHIEEKVKSKLVSWVEFSKPYGDDVTKLGTEYMRE